MFEREVDSEGNARTQRKRNHAYFYQVGAVLTVLSIVGLLHTVN